MTTKITTTLYDVEVEVDEEEVLNEMSCEDLVTYLKDTYSVSDAIGHIDDNLLLEHLCESMGTEAVAKATLSDMPEDECLALFQELGVESGPEAPSVEYLPLDEAAAPDTYWVRVNGISRCLLAQNSVVTKHGILTAKTNDEARVMARFVALGLVADDA